MSNSTLQRHTIPFDAAQVAAQAVDQHGEFDAVRTVVFPSFVMKQPLFGADLRAPSAWQAFIRMFSNDVSEKFQLYIHADNTADQGAARYDQAMLPGGVPLAVEQITTEYHPDRDTPRYSFWSQHLTVALDRGLLEEHLHTPLRVQIARPSDGMAFVIEIPAYYVAAVLYRRSPEAYDVAPQSLAQQQQHVNEEERQVLLRTLKQSAWIGLSVMVITLFFTGLLDSLAFGGCAMIAAFHIIYKRSTGRMLGRHPLRSPSD